MTKVDRIWAGITGTILVVMAISWFWERERPPIYRIVSQIECSATSFGDCSNLVNPSHGFWESKGLLEYNIRMYLSPEGRQSVGCYMLGTGPHGKDAIDRMPKNWTLSGSSDGSKWKMVDKKNDEEDWELNEKRYFPLGGNFNFRYFQFKIKATTSNDIVRLYRIGFLNDCP